tara:strand:+ start:782 stop:1519 length:738 start_codon:yes stop_codon:yes gene_type:complete
MNITLSIDQFIPRCIYFGEPVQNTIMENSRFVKLIYSDQIVIMNGLYFEIPLNITNKTIYFRRNKYFFDMNNDAAQDIIKGAQDIELAILEKYKGSRLSIYSKEHESLLSKNMKPMVYDSFQHGCIKSESGSEFNNNDDSIVDSCNTPKTSGNATCTSIATAHPSYHLRKQRIMKHTFETDSAPDISDNSSSATSPTKEVPAEEKESEVSFTSWHVILKVSGIWESMTEFGLTYKFIITPKYSES